MKIRKLQTALLLLTLIALAALSACQTPLVPTTPTTTATTSVNETSSTAAPTTAAEAISQLITPEAAKQMLAENPDIILLDVRTPAEYAEGHIAGSMLLPFDQIIARQNELPEDKSAPIIIYCRSGNRSAVAAGTLARLGYLELYDLGGIINWPYEVVRD